MKKKIIISVIIFYQVISWFLFFIQRDNMEHALILLSVLLIMSALIDAILVQSFIAAERKEKIELQIYQMQEEQKREKEYLNQTREEAEQYQELQEVFHDKLKELRTAVENGGTQSEVQEITKETEEYLTKAKIEKYCESDIINTILYLKKTQATEKGIQMRVAAEAPRKMQIEEMDICGLLCNLLDNAIEACDNISDEKRIDVKIKMQSGYLFVNVKNSYNGQAVWENGTLKTSKEDKLHHGIGTRIVKEIVKKYHGSISYNQDNKRFQVMVSLEEGIRP